ncbi:hypothetical protein FSP39_017180 [Pinctada imbricata]|uniref:WSC domain-containing protein n=1 Tax=Pinctada imbricata TaxID=66713 RepID=A0AA88YJR1_PINIB|nr:hypothetical protein FSP39_017180 [Pinctada imbricata]
MNGQLMMSNALNRDIINSCPEIDTNQRFWVGEYKTLSPWFEIIGCFAKTDVQYNETYDNSFRNEVSVCHRVCNTTYIGLQDKMCYCINEDFNGIQNSASSSCNIVCDGNSAEYCGGNDVMNVYRTARYIPTEDICPFGDICLCSQMDCQLTGVAYTARPCQERMQGACGDWVVNSVPDSWSASNERCSQQGYLTNQDNSLSFCENRQFSSPESFWVGVFRSAIHNYDQNKNKASSQLSLDAQLSVEEEKLLYCFTLTKGVIYDSTRSDAREMDTCYNKRLPFVCEIGMYLYAPLWLREIQIFIYCKTTSSVNDRR